MRPIVHPTPAEGPSARHLSTADDDERPCRAGVDDRDDGVTSSKGVLPMPLSFLAVLAVISLIGLAAAVVTTIRAESRSNAGAAASLTYRAYGA